MKSSILAGLFATGAVAQSGPWGQCGGNNWSGSTTCVSGYKCTFNNEWYSQCVPGTDSPATTLKTSTTTATPTSTTSKTSTAPGTTSTSTPGKFKWFGINQSVAEFGQGNYPGTWGKHFTFPSTSAIQVNQVFMTINRPS